MANEIIKNLFLGDWGDAMKWHSDLSMRVPTHSPIPKVVDVLDAIEPGRGGMVNMATLDALADVIAAYLKAGCKVLVHCRAGMERSPLTVAWFLRAHKGMTLAEAYDLLQSKRSIVTPKYDWLPPKFYPK